MSLAAQVNLACPRVDQLILCGDAKVTFYDAESTGTEKMFACCINTKFIENGKIHLSVPSDCDCYVTHDSFTAHAAYTNRHHLPSPGLVASPTLGTRSCLLALPSALGL